LNIPTPLSTINKTVMNIDILGRPEVMFWLTKLWCKR